MKYMLIIIYIVVAVVMLFKCFEIYSEGFSSSSIAPTLGIQIIQGLLFLNLVVYFGLIIAGYILGKSNPSMHYLPFISLVLFIVLISALSFAHKAKIGNDKVKSEIRIEKENKLKVFQDDFFCSDTETLRLVSDFGYLHLFVKTKNIKGEIETKLIGTVNPETKTYDLDGSSYVIPENCKNSSGKAFTELYQLKK